MPKRIIFDEMLMNASASVTSTTYTWNDVPGVQPPTGDTPMTAEAHMFILNGVEYQPNYFLNGDTKFKCAYKVDNVDTIMLEYIKATGLSNIKLRTDKGLNLDETSQHLEFYEKLPGERQQIIINLAGDSCSVIYEDGTFKIQEEV